MRLFVVQLGLLCSILSSSVGLCADTEFKKPWPEQGVDDIKKMYDAQIPLKERFVDENGKEVALGDFFSDSKPVILSFNYSNCPSLCNESLKVLVTAMLSISLKPGVDFQIVSIGIDPAETPETAKKTKARYLDLYGDKSTESGWHFLTGKKEAIDAVCDSVGVTYKYIPVAKEYSHPAVFVICTPEGKTSQYLNGVSVPEDTLRLSLVDASAGRLGTPFDWIVLACYSYDPNSNSFVPQAMLIMRLGAMGCAILFLIFVIFVSVRRRKRATPVTRSDETVLV